MNIWLLVFNPEMSALSNEQLVRKDPSDRTNFFCCLRCEWSSIDWPYQSLANCWYSCYWFFGNSFQRRSWPKRKWIFRSLEWWKNLSNSFSISFNSKKTSWTTKSSAMLSSVCQHTFIERVKEDFLQLVLENKVKMHRRLFTWSFSIVIHRIS